MLQRQPDMPRKGADGSVLGDGARDGPRLTKPEDSADLPVSRQGAHRESRHNKHRPQ
jgi:hypothetical protein